MNLIELNCGLLIPRFHQLVYKNLNSFLEQFIVKRTLLAFHVVIIIILFKHIFTFKTSLDM